MGWGYDNGFEQPVVWAVPLNNLHGARPTTNNYLISEKPRTNMLFYIRTPNTDYDYFANHRMGIPSRVGLYFIQEKSTLKFLTLYDITIQNAALLYSLDVKSLEMDVLIGDNYRILRDSLVRNGKLPTPYTDTKEYRENIKAKILYWKNGNWVKREELE